MKKALFSSWQKNRVTAGLLIIALFTGCKALPPLPTPIRDLGHAYQPTNVYRKGQFLPPEVRRVALLPLAGSTSASADMQAGIETLEPLVYSELEKAKRFEVVVVTPQQMKQWTGQTLWRADEPLPHDMLKRISEGTGCEAILFCQLTRYQPYQPLSVGWKFSLVENFARGGAPASPMALWTVDEVLDSGDPEVTTGARIYFTQHVRNDSAAADPATMLASPVRFGQYTLWTLFTSLPERPLQNH